MDNMIYYDGFGKEDEDKEWSTMVDINIYWMNLDGSNNVKWE